MPRVRHSKKVVPDRGAARLHLRRELLVRHGRTERTVNGQCALERPELENEGLQLAGEGHRAVYPHAAEGAAAAEPGTAGTSGARHHRRPRAARPHSPIHVAAEVLRETHEIGAKCKGDVAPSANDVRCEAAHHLKRALIVEQPADECAAPEPTRIVGPTKCTDSVMSRRPATIRAVTMSSGIHSNSAVKRAFPERARGRHGRRAYTHTRPTHTPTRTACRRETCGDRARPPAAPVRRVTSIFVLYCICDEPRRTSSTRSTCETCATAHADVPRGAARARCQAARAPCCSQSCTTRRPPRTSQSLPATAARRQYRAQTCDDKFAHCTEPRAETVARTHLYALSNAAWLCVTTEISQL